MSYAEIEAELQKLTPGELRRLAVKSWSVFVEKASEDAAQECDEADPQVLAALDDAVERANATPGRGQSAQTVRARIRGMDFKVIFKDSFIEDLERILRTIAVSNPLAARKLGELIVQRSESLKFFPECHPKVSQRPQIRRFIVKKHFKVFYRIQPAPQIVEILRCWDGRRKSDPQL